jgi:hypothetical protein
MKNVIRISGLKCDNPKCDWSEEVSVDDYMSWIEKPCPKCGEVVLTQKDYESCMKLYRFFTNPIIKFLLQPFVHEKPTSRVNIHDNTITVTKL